jgi:hypothetical protein
MWIGPQLSVAPLIDEWAVSASPPTSGSETVSRAMDDPRGTLAELVRGSDTLKRFNILSFLAVAPPIGIPSFRALTPGDGPVVGLQSEPVAALAVFAIIALGLILGALFYGLVGHLVREGGFDLRRYAADVPNTLAMVFTLFALIAVIGLGLGVPIAAFLAVMSTVSPVVSSIVGPIVVGILLWAIVYLFFTTDALFVSRAWPARAVQYSILVVRSNFWSALGFISLLLIISSGFPFVWDQFVANLRTPGIVVAILGHNYISSGLAAASMTYYKERFERMIASHEGSNAPVAPVRG